MGIGPILLDTNAYTAFKRGVIEAVEIIRQTPLIGINPVVLGELWGGFNVGGRPQQNREELRAFLNSPRVRVLPLVKPTAQIYALIYAHLRQKGTPIPTNDMWIAASARQHELRLFTYDKHFTHVPNLSCGHLLADLSL